jgi:hypothetical protein
MPYECATISAMHKRIPIENPYFGGYLNDMDKSDP